jgi:hypothetical protein
MRTMPAPRTCYLHIGLPKTGTSYLQTIFGRSKDALAQQGLTLWPETTGSFQVMLDVRDELDRDTDPAEWFEAVEHLRAEAAAFEGSRALLSQELLSAARADQVPRLLAALEGYEVQVVVTVRGLAAQLPSMWQQQVKGRGLTAYDVWVERMTARQDFALIPGCDLVGALERWRQHVPPERIHVITVPRRGAPKTLLLDRFCEVVGVDPATLDVQSGYANSSLGAVQAELLRRVNVALGDRLPHSRAGYRGPGRIFLAETILARQEGHPPRLPLTARPWIEERSRELVEELRTGGYRLVGDLDELVPEESAFEETPTVVTEADVAESAAQALAEILVARSKDRTRRVELRRQVARQRRRIAELEGARGANRLRRVVGRVRRRLAALGG